MARVTVEDCIDKVDNRFDLVLMASHRARAVSSGAPILVQRDNDKNPVVALREIGDGKLSPGDLREDVIHALQKHVEIDEPETEAPPPIILIPIILRQPALKKRTQSASPLAKARLALRKVAT